MYGVMKFGTKDVWLWRYYTLPLPLVVGYGNNREGHGGAFMIVSDFDVVQVHKTVVSLSVTQRRSEQKQKSLLFFHSETMRLCREKSSGLVSWRLHTHKHRGFK